MSITVVVTGANRGIGLELCRQYTNVDANVFAVCRSRSDELDALQVKVIDGVDVTSSKAIDRLCKKLKNVSIDILINNAGVFLGETLEEMDFDAIALQFQVNAMGPLRVTQALLGRLNENAKVALITSRMGSVADNTSGGYYGYRMSKAALNAAGMSLARDLKSQGVALGIFHPGFVQTRMVSFAGDISAEEAAKRLVKRIDELNLDNSGTFWHTNGEVLPW
ncbi:MAG: SDR family oxidoreductase [Gammaproteobacteria bacterium]|nr:SDR family oxidoreductase [Gammaproteobacteria bacterium]